MKTNEFNAAYRYAQTVKVAQDDFFYCAGWWWLDLTRPQLMKMYALLLAQGSTEGENERGKYIDVGCLRIFRNPQ